MNCEMNQLTMMNTFEHTGSISNNSAVFIVALIHHRWTCSCLHTLLGKNVLVPRSTLSLKNHVNTQNAFVEA